MRRREFLAMGGGAAVAAHTTCASREDQPGGTPIRVLVMPRTSMSGLYVALEDGYFEELGLRIETHTLTRSLQMIPLLADGQFHTGMVGMSPAVINAVDRGAQLSLVAAREYASTTCGTPDTLFGYAPSFPNGMDDLSELRGKRVALNGRQTLNEYVLDIMLERGGLTQDDIELLILDQQEAVAALFAGRIDAMISSHLEKDPTSVSANYVKGPGIVDLLPDHQRGFIAFGRAMLEEEHEVGVRFLTGYLRGVNAYMDGRTPAFLERIAKASGLDPEEARTACRDTMVRDGNLDVGSVQRFIGWAVGKGYCKDTVKAEQLVDTSYIDEVQRRHKWPGRTKS